MAVIGSEWSCEEIASGEFAIANVESWVAIAGLGVEMGETVESVSLQFEIEYGYSFEIVVSVSFDRGVAKRGLNQTILMIGDRTDIAKIFSAHEIALFAAVAV